MITLLSIGEAVLEQSRDKDLVGGGDLVLLPEGVDVEVAKVEAPAPAPTPAPAAAPVKKTYTALSRLDFNARAQERFVPLFWRTDANKNGALEPAELVTLIGPWNLSLSELVKGEGFTPKFDELYGEQMAFLKKIGLSDSKIHKIDVPDSDLYNWITGKGPIPAAHDHALMTRLRKFNNSL